MKANRSSRFGRDTGAVSDTVGSILLVAITVIMAVALGGLIFAVAKPVETVQANLTATIDPGNDGWGNGDEALILTHGGGEAIAADDARVQYSIAGTRTSLTGATELGSAFADGKFTIGEKWTRGVTILANVDVSMQLVLARTGGSQVVANVATTTDCSGDSSPPQVSFQNQAPPDVSIATTGSVTVEAVLEDECQGVDSGVVPNLEFRLNDGTDPAYNPGTPMTLIGPNTWRGTMAGLTFASAAGDTLQYRLNPVMDLGGCCSGPSNQVASDFVDDPTAYVTVSTIIETEGSVSSPASLNAADGVAATLEEEGNPAGTIALTETLSGTSASGANVDSPNNALTANDARALLDSNGETLSVTGFDLAGSPTSILSVQLGFSGKRENGTGGTDPQYQLTANNLSGCSADTATTLTVTSQPNDDTYPTTAKNVTALCPSWTEAILSSMRVDIRAVMPSGGNQRDLEIDHVFVIVKYSAPATVYGMDIEFHFGPLPTVNVTTHELQIKYQTDTETFNVQVWNGTAWVGQGSAMAPSLPFVFEYTFVSQNQLTGGVAGGPRIRIVDANPSNTIMHSIDIDYARIEST